jgi:hypothetical protein
VADGNVFAPTERMASDSELSPEDQINLYLGQTRPWVGLLTVLMALATAMMLCSGAAMQVSMSALGSAFPTEDLGPMGGFVKYFGLIYILFGLVYAIPMVLLGRYTIAAGPTDLHQAALAVRYQRDFWRVIGVMTLMFIVLYCGGVAAVVAMAPT